MTDSTIQSPENIPEGGLTPEQFTELERARAALVTETTAEGRLAEELTGEIPTEKAESEETKQAREAALAECKELIDSGDDSRYVRDRVLELIREHGLVLDPPSVTVIYKLLLEEIAAPGDDSISVTYSRILTSELKDLYDSQRRIPLPQQEMDAYLNSLAGQGKGRVIDTLVETFNYRKPDFPAEDQGKLAHWREEVNDIDIICEWDTEYGCYILYLPQAKGLKDNLFAISENAGDAKKVFDMVKNLAVQGDQETNPEDRATSLYEQAFTAAKEYIVAEPEIQKNLLKRIHLQQDQKAFDAMLVGIGASGWTAKDIEEQIQAAQAMRDSQHFEGYYQRRIDMVLEYLKDVKRLEEKRSRELRSVIVPDKKRAINAEYDGVLESLYSDLIETFNQANERERDWLQEMVDRGVLQALPVRTDRGWSFQLRPNAARGEELKQEALDLAIRKKNEKLYGITEEERRLIGEDWKEFAQEKRKQQLNQIKTEISAAVQKIIDGGVGKIFGAVFKGRFTGESELKPDRESVGETMANKEFLRELFADREFFRSLIFQVREKTGVISDTDEKCEAGKNVVKELVDLLKMHFPEEGDAIAANLLDSLYLEKLESDDARERERREGTQQSFRGYTAFGDIHSHNLATSHFIRYDLLRKRYGLATEYDQLSSFAQENLGEVNTGWLTGESHAQEGTDNYLARYLEICQRHFSPEIIKGLIKEVLLPHSIADIGRRDFIQAGAAFTSELNHPAIIMRILKQGGYMSWQEIRAMLKETSEGNRGNEGAVVNLGVEDDIRKAKAALFQVYTEDIEAILDRATSA